MPVTKPPDKVGASDNPAVEGFTVAVAAFTGVNQIFARGAVEIGPDRLSADFGNGKLPVFRSGFKMILARKVLSTGTE